MRLLFALDKNDYGVFLTPWGSKEVQTVHFDETGKVIPENEKDEDGNK